MARAFQAISIVKKRTHGQHAPVDATFNSCLYGCHYLLEGSAFDARDLMLTMSRIVYSAGTIKKGRGCPDGFAWSTPSLEGLVRFTFPM